MLCNLNVEPDIQTSERLFGIAASQWAAVSIYHSHVLPSESFDDGYDFYDDFEGPTRVICVWGEQNFCVWQDSHVSRIHLLPKIQAFVKGLLLFLVFYTFSRDYLTDLGSFVEMKV